VFKREEEELCHIFGTEVGSLLYSHASLEQSFKQNNVGPDQKMLPFDDDLPKEARQVALNIRKTISSLVRHFSNPQIQIKLKATFGETRSNELAGFIESFDQLKTLWLTKLTTPLEEEMSIKEQLRMLQSRTQKLKEIRDQKKEHLQKYEEESKEQKEQREFEIQNLKKTIADENATKEQRIKEMNDFGKNRSDMLAKRHNEKCDRLNKEIKALEDQLKGLKDKNKADENQMREVYKRADNAYRDNLQNYDAEMKQQTRSKEQALEQHDQIFNERQLVADEHKDRIDERK